ADQQTVEHLVPVPVAVHGVSVGDAEVTPRRIDDVELLGHDLSMPGRRCAGVNASRWAALPRRRDANSEDGCGSERPSIAYVDVPSASSSCAARTSAP